VLLQASKREGEGWKGEIDSLKTKLKVIEDSAAMDSESALETLNKAHAERDALRLTPEIFNPSHLILNPPSGRERDLGFRTGAR
jgi:hypothetical protein